MNSVAFIVAAFTVLANVVTPATETLSKLVCPSTSISTKSPSPLNVVAVTTPTIFAPPARTFNPDLAVTIPIESIFVTSSYVSVPPIETSPANVVTPVTLRLVNGPSNLVAVIMPDECTL